MRLQLPRRTILERFAALIRFSSFDVSSPQGRSRERFRRVALTSVSSFGAKGITVLTLLVTIPLTVAYLGTERFGVWMTMNSVFAFLSFADLGLGNGLLNGIAEAHGKGDRIRAREYLSTVLFMLCVMALVMGSVLVLLWPWLNWGRIFNVGTALAESEVGVAVGVLAGCFLIGLPLGVVQRVRNGYQEGFLNGFWDGLGALVSLLAVVSAVHFDAGLPWLVLAMGGGPVLSTLLNALQLFGIQRRWLLPRLSSVRLQTLVGVTRIGALFFVVQIALNTAFLSDNFVATHILGPASVASLSVTAKVFAVVPMLLGLVWAPLWPAYAESMVRREVDWVRRTLGRSMRLSVIVSGLSSIALVLFGRSIIEAWVGPAVIPGFLLLVGFGIWNVMLSTYNAAIIVLNAAGKIRFQAITTVLMAISAVTAKVFLARLMGIAGIILAMDLFFFLFAVLPLAVYLPRCLRRLDAGSRDESTD